MKTNSIKRRNLILIIVVLALALLGAGYYYWNNQNSSTKNSINSFDECVAAGNPVLESYPEQCNADGKHFVRDISNEYFSEKGVRIIINTPKSGAIVTSPITITGEVPGNWSFEASFPVELQAADGSVVSSAGARLEGDWTTEELVPFKAEISFSGTKFVGSSNQANLILKKDNPSGLAKNDDTVTIPIIIRK